MLKAKTGAPSPDITMTIGGDDCDLLKMPNPYKASNHMNRTAHNFDFGAERRDDNSFMFPNLQNKMGSSVP